ncbi:MAG: Nramp family divalent metal transporter [Thermoleophilia bacterium]|nr:Nramp family divalent metal transporter [Thermoleophilia bacterium]
MLLTGGGLTAFLAVLGPGILAGLSDDDPAGITTYSILGAEYGYQLLWVLVLSTGALIIFHLIAVRVGVVTGKGLMTLVVEEWGPHIGRLVLLGLVVANLGTLCAEFAGVAAAFELLGLENHYLVVPVAAIGITLLVLKGSFRRIEHILLLLSAVFVTYIASGFLAGPDWGETAKGMVLPTMPLNRDAVLIAVATVGTTLAPWGLTFIQSYAVDKRLEIKDLSFERVDVIVGAVLTGVIGLFVVIACAATIHASGDSIETASDAARALEPLAGSLASRLFGIGFLGAALLAVAIVPLATSYSVSETFGKRHDLNDGFAVARVFYLSFIGAVTISAAVILIPGAPLIKILFLSQALNAVLLLAVLPFLWSLARKESVMGTQVLRGTELVLSGTTLVLIAVSILALGFLTVT